MGASFDDRLGTGTDAADAFRSARDDAAWQHGHGGYTGTIAEKHDFALITLPARMTVERFVRLVDDAEQHMYVTDESYRDELRWATTATAKRKVEAAHKKATAAKARFYRKLTPQAAAAVERAVEIAHGDKWGPCVAVELTGAEATEARKRLGQAGRRVRVFRFFGMCSS